MPKKTEKARAAVDGANEALPDKKVEKQSPSVECAETGPVTLEQNIQRSKDAQRRASEAADNLPVKFRDKCVASDDTKTISGWKERPEGYATATPQEVADHSKAIGHELRRAGACDQVKNNGFPGKYHASHAEKQQAVANPNEPIGVSEPMCDDCRAFFQKEAKHRGKDQVVTDPETTRIFKPDGTIIDQRPNGSVTVFYPDGSVSSTPDGGVS